MKPTPKPSDVLLEFLAKFNYTQIQLAEKIGCSPSMVNHWINGRYPITPKLAIEIARVFRYQISAKKLLTYQAHFLINQELKSKFK